MTTGRREKSAPPIVLLSDFGYRDHYVGVMRGVIAAIAPAATVIDLTHGIPPQAIAAGAMVLEQSWRYFPARTIFVAVVDPGDVTVLQARPQASLTLVTCYPFYFIGDAPQRYIVQASLANTEQLSSKAASSETVVETSKLNKEKMQ